MLDPLVSASVPAWQAIALFGLGLAIGLLSHRERADAALQESSIALIEQYEHESRSPMTAERVRFWNQALEHALHQVKKR